MHLLHLAKIVDCEFKLKPAYYFDFSKAPQKGDKRNFTMRVLEFTKGGFIAKLDIYPARYFSESTENRLKSTFLTKSKLKLYLKRTASR